MNRTAAFTTSAAMRPERFPKRRLDGSFCIELPFAIVTNDPVVLISRINAWIEEWVRTNRFWENNLAHGEGGVLDFYDEFARPPYCVTADSGSLFLRVEGCAGAKKWWKDWIASRLMPDLRVAFKEVQSPPMAKARDCPEVNQ
jgi:hypothetical protein